MTPAFGESGKQNGDLFGQVWDWNRQNKLGEVFDSSTGYDFISIGGGKLSPDVSWIEKYRLAGISLKQFIPVVPDLAIELRFTTDRLNDVRNKMLEYQRLGVKLAPCRSIRQGDATRTSRIFGSRSIRLYDDGRFGSLV